VPEMLLNISEGGSEVREREVQFGILLHVGDGGEGDAEVGCWAPEICVSYCQSAMPVVLTRSLYLEQLRPIAVAKRDIGH
jgi:hypothetical protein